MSEKEWERVAQKAIQWQMCKKICDFWAGQSTRPACLCVDFCRQLLAEYHEIVAKKAINVEREEIK